MSEAIRLIRLGVALPLLIVAAVVIGVGFGVGVLFVVVARVIAGDV